MFKVEREEIQWAGQTLSLETGRLANQADGSVLVRYGDTSVLCTVVSARKADPNLDFFPLMVLYQEKAYAAGKIPGGFVKRESKPSEKEVLTSRLIDRPMRPLFAEGFRNDTQVVCTVLSFDGVNDPDILAMVGAAAAASLSGVPFHGPMAGARVGRKNNELILNPTIQELDCTQLDLVVAGTEEGVLMVESQAQELSEAEMLEAVMFGHKGFQPVLAMIKKLVKKAGKKAWALPKKPEGLEELKKELSKAYLKKVKQAYEIKDKKERYAALDALKEAIVEDYEAKEASDETMALLGAAYSGLKEDHVRGQMLKDRKRIDGRSPEDIRPIHCEVGVLPRTHGSALFTRGETQALVVTTLGTGQDEQIVDTIAGEFREDFMLHYNFPPFSVGETGRMGPPGRREIGHGKLAWRALKPVMPSKAAFPYTVRAVSDILACNGSSSMATVCASSMSMMDAGVPLEKAVSGIAMGLVKEGNNFVILSDIMGDEDHLGDMDFKVTGTKDGVTALQMDLKITSINENIMQQALEQANAGRLHILKAMEKAIKAGRDEMSPYAPKMELFRIPKDKIGEVIGPGGKIIRQIVEETDAKIDIEEDGLVKVSGVNPEKTKRAVEWIQSLVEVPEVGKTYTGKVVKVTDFGAFVNFLGSSSGLIHVSEIEPNCRVEKVTDYLNVGDEVVFKVVGLDNKGKLRLSRKACM